MSNKDYISQRENIVFKKKIKINSAGTVVGRKEHEGPLGEYMDIFCDDEKMGQKSFENAESEMCRLALNITMSKGKLCEKNIDYIIAGDLLNQCTGAGYGLVSFDIPYFGLYGACSTFAEAMIIGGLLIESGAAKNVACLASSHFCSAERQFRFPLEYGGISEATAQNTVTGAGCVILSETNEDEEGVYLTEALPGIVNARGIKDASNMGAAMCTAASDTILRYFNNSKTTADKFDLIATGDLGKEGHSIAFMMMKNKIEGISGVFNDCGMMIYDLKNQDVGCGGSGCGCSAVVSSGFIYNSMLKNEMKNCLIVGTGAMMSPKSLLQGHDIPAIAHLVRWEKR